MGEISIGFSGNTAQHVYIAEDSDGVGNKCPGSDLVESLEGSGFNVALAVAQRNVNSKLSILTCANDRTSRWGAVMEEFVHEYRKTTCGNVVVNLVDALHRSSHSVIYHNGDAEEPKVVSYKGRVLEHKISSAAREIGRSVVGSKVLVLASIRLVEMPFVEAAVQSSNGALIMASFHGSLLRDLSVLGQFLSKVDVAVFNEQEYKFLEIHGLGFKKIHDMGVRFIIETRGVLPGEFSYDNNRDGFDTTPIESLKNHVGAGDSLLGNLAVHLAENGLPDNKKTCSEVLSRVSEKVSEALAGGRTVFIPYTG